MTRIKISGTDNEFSGQQNDSLLRAALRNRVGLPYECNSGGCGCCKVEVLEGEYEDLYPDSPAISDRDKRKNRVLACKIIPQGNDLVVKSSIDKLDDSFIPPQRFLATLIKRVPVAKDLMEFVFSTDSDLDYLAGQYFMFNVFGDIERAYSNSSVASSTKNLSFIVKRVEGGECTSYLFDELSVGDKVKLDGPFGNAYLREGNPRDIVLIAGGSGLSPMAAIVRRLNESVDFRGNIHFFYGVRSVDDLNERYINSISNNLGSRFKFTPVLSEHSDESQLWAGEVGYVHEVVAKSLKTPIDYEYYMCGPPPMIAAAQKLLMLENGVPYEQMHFDKFV